MYVTFPPILPIIVGTSPGNPQGELTTGVSAQVTDSMQPVRSPGLVEMLLVI